MQAWLTPPKIAIGMALLVAGAVAIGLAVAQPWDSDEGGEGGDPSGLSSIDGVDGSSSSLTGALPEAVCASVFCDGDEMASLQRPAGALPGEVCLGEEVRVSDLRW